MQSREIIDADCKFIEYLIGNLSHDMCIIELQVVKLFYDGRLRLSDSLVSRAH